MPKSWQEEVQEILNRADALSAAAEAADSTAPQPAQRRGSYVELLGRWILGRFATTGEMLVTAAVLVVAALFMSIVLRQFASIVAVAGAIVFASALVRGVMERRAARSPGARGNPGYVARAGHRASQPAPNTPATTPRRVSPPPLAVARRTAAGQ